ncbi:MAG: HAMP domain-containing histidine kinase [Acetobacteraceae bacterium]|nr:HAMP domain-containing histidine kinase [Acetobacteraceae bacterium]
MAEHVTDLPPSEPTPLRLAAERLDAERELVSIVQDIAGLAAERLVRLESAIQPDLTLWADKAALRQMLAAPLRAAVARSPGGRVLLGAGRHGGRVQVSVLDDGLPADRAVQEAALRDAARLVALHGGTLEVNVRANAGTTVVIRLPEPAAASASASVPANVLGTAGQDGTPAATEVLERSELGSG